MNNFFVITIHEAYYTRLVHKIFKIISLHICNMLLIAEYLQSYYFITLGVRDSLAYNMDPEHCCGP